MSMRMGQVMVMDTDMGMSMAAGDNQRNCRYILCGRCLVW